MAHPCHNVTSHSATAKAKQPPYRHSVTPTRTSRQAQCRGNENAQPLNSIDRGIEEIEEIEGIEGVDLIEGIEEIEGGFNHRRCRSVSVGGGCAVCRRRW